MGDLLVFVGNHPVSSLCLLIVLVVGASAIVRAARSVGGDDE